MSSPDYDLFASLVRTSCDSEANKYDNLLEIVEKSPINCKTQLLLIWGENALRKGNISCMEACLQETNKCSARTFESVINRAMQGAAKGGHFDILRDYVNKFNMIRMSDDLFFAASTDECRKFILDRGYRLKSENEPFITVTCLSLTPEECLSTVVFMNNIVAISEEPDVCDRFASKKYWACVEFALKNGSKWTSYTDAQLVEYAKWKLSL
jgi:hypothetical protein